MTDKQIIIDGVDVSGCECHNPNIKMDCLLYPLQSDACKNNPNCHYKLYKRKEQECETLASQLDFEVQKKECLEQECEELNNEYWKLEQGNDFLAEKNSKLKGCLTEIKEIGETCSFTDDSELLLSRIEHILEKISECEGNDEYS